MHIKLWESNYSQKAIINEINIMDCAYYGEWRNCSSHNKFLHNKYCTINCGIVGYVDATMNGAQ